jgi:hypothetical protein
MPQESSNNSRRGGAMVMPIAAPGGHHVTTTTSTHGGGGPVLARLARAIAVLLQATSLLATSASFEPMLFMDMNDIYDSWGLVWPAAHTVAPNATYRPPPLNYSAGAVVIAVIPSSTQPRQFEVYAENTTGWEPLISLGSRLRGKHACQLLRFLTVDFVAYSTPHISLWIEPCSGTPSMKSIARSPDGLYVMFTACGGLGTYTSHSQGMSWSKADTTGIVKPDKDDLNIIFNRGRFVDMQIVWQNHTLRYCDK